MLYETINAQFIGYWPLTDAHDPALDEAGIPEGAKLCGLFDAYYTKYVAPVSIPGFTLVETLAELSSETYCVLNASSGFDYVIAISDKSFSFEMNRTVTPTKLRNMRVINIPKFLAISSGDLPFGDIFAENGFSSWITAHDNLIRDLIYASPDFMWHENEGRATWIWAVKEGVSASDCKPYELIEFESGIWLVATGDENDKADLSATVADMQKWIAESNVFELDERPGHRGMCHMPGTDGPDQAMGIAQQEIFLPIKLKT